MHKVLLIESNPHLEALYSLNLEIYVDVETVTKQLAEFAIKYIEEEKYTPEIIITRDEIKSEKTANEIYNYLIKKEINIPILILGKDCIENPTLKIESVKSRLDLKNVISSTSKLLKITAMDMAKKVVDENYPIPIHFFKNIKYLTSDLFIDDLDKPGEVLPKFSKEEEITPEVIAEIMDQGYPFLYVQKNNRLKLVNSISEEIITKLDSGELSLEEKLVFSDKMIGNLGKKLMKQGFDPETIVMAKNLVHSVSKVAQKDTKISRLMDRLLSSEASYRYKNVQLVTYFGIRIIKGSDWGSPQLEEKFIFAATLHDITLTKDSWCRIHSHEQLNEADLDDEVKEKILNHAADAAKLIGTIPKAPMGAETIISKHHGSLSGKGFAEYASTSMTPIELAFYVSEEYSRIILSMPDGEIDQDKAIERLLEVFPTNRFKKMTNILSLIAV